MRKSAFVALILLGFAVAGPASATPFLFSTGDPDGRIATASRPASAGKIEIESADDFLLGSTTSITGGTFTGLLSGATLSDIGEITVEIYRIFPLDSTNPPSGNVPTRTNSPSDFQFDDRSTSDSTLSFNCATLTDSFTADNSVLNGINRIPDQTTGGEGSVTGSEVRCSVTFSTPFVLPADHYFFVPQVEVTPAAGEFFWLSAPKPNLVSPFTPDLQSWIRDENLAPDWLRVGTDVVGGNPAPTFNAAFSLVGDTVPEPGTLALLMMAALAAGLGMRSAPPSRT